LQGAITVMMVMVVIKVILYQRFHRGKCFAASRIPGGGESRERLLDSIFKVFFAPPSCLDVAVDEDAAN